MRRRTLLTIAVFVAAPIHASQALSFRTLTTASLPSGVIARDVRWAGADEVFISLGKQGVVRTRVDLKQAPLSIMPSSNRGGFPVSGRLAVGGSHLLVAAGMGGVGWIPLAGADRRVSQRGLLAVMDIDAQRDTAAILGADSGPVTGLEREGTIAWTGTLSKGLSDLRPLMRGRSHPGGKDMARCSVLETGAIRFMRDGTLVVAPGSEPGIYRYDAGGKLLQTWDTAQLGMVDDCSIADAELQEIARDFGRRIDWYASRLILDEILPLPSGPGLLLRRVENGVTKWDVVTLPYRGKSERIALPLTLPTPRGHVRGDVRGDKLVLIAFDDPLPNQKPVAPPKMVVLSIGQ